MGNDDFTVEATKTSPFFNPFPRFTKCMSLKGNHKIFLVLYSQDPVNMQVRKHKSYMKIIMPLTCIVIGVEEAEVYLAIFVLLQGAKLKKHTHDTCTAMKHTGTYFDRLHSAHLQVARAVQRCIALCLVCACMRATLPLVRLRTLAGGTTTTSQQL